MKFRYLMFVLIFLVGIFGIVISTSKALSNTEQNNIDSIMTEYYAIYPSKIIEENSTEINEYVHYERNLNLKFPQIYYSNKYGEYDEELESSINELLLLQSIGNDSSFLIDRYNRDIKEYTIDYMITKAGTDLFSIKYFGHLYSISRAHNFCYGITINTKTGEPIKLTDYISYDDIKIKIKNKNYIYTSLPEYNKQFVDNAITDFFENHSEFTNFYIANDRINLIIPVTGGNTNYIILEILSKYN